VQAGRVDDPGEFLNKAVYDYVLARDLGQEYAPEEIGRMICERLDDIERGDTIDGEEAFRQLRALNAERGRQQREPIRTGPVRSWRSSRDLGLRCSLPWLLITSWVALEVALECSGSRRSSRCSKAGLLRQRAWW
jgi:hypothetical protein